MSEQATDWAIRQRGLLPAAKLVLWHLCDRHTPGSGCFPSQDHLIAAAEISSASLNTQLRRLGDAGLIRRQRRPGQGPGQWKSTRYILGFEADFAQKSGRVFGQRNGQKPTPDLAQSPAKPCLDFDQKHPKPCPDSEQSQLRILDTNLVRKKLLPRLARTRARMTHTRGRPLKPPASQPAARALASRQGGCDRGNRAGNRWLAGRAEYDLHADILPVLQALTLRKHDSPIRTWAYFTAAIAKRHAQRTAHAARPKGAGEPEPVPKPAAYKLMVMTASWINAGRYVPPSAVSTSKRAALLAAGLVTEVTLRARQIY